MDEKIDEIVKQLLAEADAAVKTYAAGMLQGQGVNPLNITDEQRTTALLAARATVLPPIVQAAAAWQQAKSISGVVDALVGLVFDHAGSTLSGLTNVGDSLERIAAATEASVFDDDEEGDE